MSAHQNIEELIRSRLGEAEVTPSKGAWKAVQRKLRWKKFLRFDPSGFNIWYAGALLVAGTTTLVLLNWESPSSPLPEVEEIPMVEEEKEAVQKQPVVEVRREVRSEEKKESLQAEDLKIEDNQKRENRAEKRAARKEETGGISEKEKQAKQSKKTADSIFHPQPVSQLIASENMGCAPLMVDFRSYSVNASAILWNFGNGEPSSAIDTTFIFEKAGIYAVSLTAFGSGGDSAVSYEVIRVYPAPVAGFEMGEGLEQFDGSISMELMNYSTGAFSYSWDMISADRKKVGEWTTNEFQPSFSNKDIPDDARQIRLVVENEHACTDTALAEITGLDLAKRSLTFPTVFSGNPNGPSGGYYTPNDMRLDIFHPHFSEEPEDYLLKVYSKSGEVVFETHDILQGWDGYFMQAPVAGGVYIWVATGTWQNGSTINLRGDITLLWNDRL